MKLTRKDCYLLEEICLVKGCHNASGFGVTCNECAERHDMPDCLAPQASIDLKTQLEEAGQHTHLGPISRTRVDL